MRRFVLRLLETAAQGFSGGIAYYSSEWLTDCFTFREGVNPQIARLFFFAFPFLAISGFVLITMFWYRFRLYQREAHYPEIPIVIGGIIFMPLYFEFASHLIYNRTPIVVSEVAKDLVRMYVVFPLTVLEVGTYTLSLHVLALAAVSALVTGYILRKRVLHIDV